MLLIVLPIALGLFLLVTGIMWFTPDLRVRLLLWQQKPQQASNFLEYMIEKNPERMKLQRKLAEIYFVENRRDKTALKLFELVLRLKLPFPWRDELFPLVAKYYISEGRKDAEAIRVIEKAVRKEIKRLKSGAL